MSNMASDARDTLRIAGFIGESITDGPGLRATLFLQGCTFACEGCHNPQSQPLGGGEKVAWQHIYERIRTNPLVSGVTLSGGEPFLQAEALHPLARQLKADGYELAIYTGFLFEDLIAAHDDKYALLKLSDILVDGPFILAERSLKLKFKGSANQRIIDVPASLAAGEATLSTDIRWL